MTASTIGWSDGARLFQDPAWNAFLSKARPLLTTQETRILAPAPFFKERLAESRRSGGRHDLQAPSRSARLAFAALALSLRRRGAGRLSIEADQADRPLAAGGGIDFTARTTAQKLSDVLGHQVVVENQGGAGGTIGVNAVVRAAPDGYPCSIIRSPAW